MNDLRRDTGATVPISGGLHALLARLYAVVTTRIRWERDVVRNYAHLLGGSVTRLVLSLIYFVALTNALHLGDFGLFVTSASVGMVLGRLLAFGYGANMFVVAATRPRLLGSYLGVLGIWLVASLPFCLALALLLHWLFFPGDLAAYLTIVMVEIVVWRLIDLVATINGGLGRYARSAAAYNVGFAARSLAALAFLLSGAHSLTLWAVAYAVANSMALALVLVTMMPRTRLRVRRRSLFLRSRNAFALGSAAVVSMAQGETDKVLVLAFGGEVSAGLFGACMRLIDLTAMPVRAFNVLMIRAILRDPSAMGSYRSHLLVEMGIVAISTAAFGVIALALHIWPTLLGHGIAQAAPLLPLLFAVPAFRNLIEYQAELLYAWQRIFGLLWISAVLIVVKSALITLAFWKFQEPAQWGCALNGVFLAAYLTSCLCTYGRKPRLTKGSVERGRVQATVRP